MACQKPGSRSSDMNPKPCGPIPSLRPTPRSVETGIRRVEPPLPKEESDQAKLVVAGFERRATPPPQPVIAGVANVGSEPTTITCPSCRHNVVTVIRYSIGIKTHALAAFLCALCCWFLAPIPYIIDSTKAKEHYCPHCLSYVGTYQ